MIKIFGKTGLLLTLTVFVSQHAFATYPLYHSRFYNGLVALRGSQDTLRGEVLLDPPFYDEIKANKKLFAKHPGDIVVSQGSKLLFIPKNHIAFVRLYDKGSTTDFRSFTEQQDTLLLRLLSSGKVNVYDAFLSPLKNIFERYPYLGNQTIYLCKDSILASYPAQFCWSYKHHILKFVNQRYHTDLKSRDFRTTGQMFEYISQHG